MSMITLPGAGVGGAGRPAGGPSVSETYWGYEIRDHRKGRDGEAVTEPLLKFLGLIFVLAAYGQWLLPGSLLLGDALIAKATFCFLMGVAGLWLYWVASRGFATDVEVDMTRREIRMVRRNGSGRRRVEAVFPMARIESAYLRRTKAPGERAVLCLRLRAPEAVVPLARGDQRALESLLRRVTHDLRPMRDRIDEKLRDGAAFRTSRRP